MPVLDSAWSPSPFFPTDPAVVWEEGSFDTTVTETLQTTTFLQVDILLGSNADEGLLGTQVILTMPFLPLSSFSTPSRLTCER